MVVLVGVLTVVVALLALLVAGLLRSHAEIIRALHDLGADLDPDSPTGTTSSRPTPSRTQREPRAGDRTAFDVVGETLDGDGAHIGVVGAPHSTLLAFLTGGCSTCAGFWEAFADPNAVDVPGGARLVAVTKSGAYESLSQLRQVAPPKLTVVMSNEAWETYDVPLAPYFVYVDGESGRIVGEGAATNWEHVVALMNRAIGDAGLDVDTGRRRRRGPSRAEREAQADRALLAAGLRPGDPAFYPSRQRQPEDGDA